MDHPKRSTLERKVAELDTVQQSYESISTLRKVVAPLELLQVLPEVVILHPTSRIYPCFQPSPAAVNTIGMHPSNLPGNSGSVCIDPGTMVDVIVQEASFLRYSHVAYAP